MRRALVAAISVLAALTLLSAAAPVPAQAAPDSGVQGTVLDTTCCQPPCPPPPSCRVDAVVPCPLPNGAGASIICPQLRAPDFCTQAQAGCPPPPIETPDFPPYLGEAGTVLVRRAGSVRILGRVPVEAGRFTAHLVPGRYVFRAHVAEPCWTGNRQVVEIEADRWIPLVLRVSNDCIARPDDG